MVRRWSSCAHRDGISPLFRNLGTGCRWVTEFYDSQSTSGARARPPSPNPLPPYPLHRTLSGPQRLCGRCVEEKCLLTRPGLKPWHCCSARNRHVTVPTTPCQPREQIFWNQMSVSQNSCSDYSFVTLQIVANVVVSTQNWRNYKIFSTSINTEK